MIRFAQIYRNENGQWFMQVAKKYDLAPVDTAWQDSKELGAHCVTPSVDIEDEIISCTDEANAMTLLAVHYANEYHKQSLIKAPY